MLVIIILLKGKSFVYTQSGRFSKSIFVLQKNTKSTRNYYGDDKYNVLILLF